MSQEGGKRPVDTLIPFPEEPNETVPVADLDGSSIYRRRIRLTCEPGFAKGELEDDFHHFEARVEHDGRRVTRVGGTAHRFPWTTCPGAVAPLAQLEGQALTRDLHHLAQEVQLHTQCTHLFDAATLAIALAASGRTRCVYDAEVPEPQAGRMRVRLQRDGESLLDWELRDFQVQTPGPMQGSPLIGRAFSQAVRALQDPELEEPILVLRRAVAISMARGFDMDRVRDPRAFGLAVGARCHTFSDAHGAEAVRIVGANRDFTDSPERLLRSR